MSITQSCKVFAEYLEAQLFSGLKLVVETTPDALLASAIVARMLAKRQLNFSVCFSKKVESIIDEINIDASKYVLFIGFAEQELIVEKMFIPISVHSKKNRK